MKAKRSGRAPGHRQDAGVSAALNMVRVAIGAQAASVFAQLLTMAVSEEVEIVEFGRRAGIEGDAPLILENLRRVDAAFGDAFGCRFFDDILGIKAKLGGDPTHVAMSNGLASLIAWPVSRPKGTDAPRPDRDTLRWVEIACAAAGSDRGHHIVLRARIEDTRAAADYAAMCAAVGTRAAYIASDKAIAAAVLGAELYGPGLVVVVDGSRLVVGEGGNRDAWDDEAISAPTGTLEATTFTATASKWLADLKNVYVWRIPPVGALPSSLRGIVGGCIDRIGYDRKWKTDVLRSMAPALGSGGFRALLALHSDPRDARPLVEVAVAAGSAAGTTVDEACSVLARSLGADEPEMQDQESFDERLLADGDCRSLFERAGALKEGGRILFHGAPGGGKTALARAIALRIDPEQPVFPIAPALFLMKGWGAMERRLTALFANAEAKGAIILADELGSLCPTRDADGARHGNAMLAQSLTDEWLRLLDAHPRLVVIATVNDLGSVDAAVRRRFQACVHVVPDLDPRRERIAWDVMFATEPPKGWLPCGASVSDFTSAAERCRLLGRRDPVSFADAVQVARNLRTVNARRPLIRQTAH